MRKGQTRREHNAPKSSGPASCAIGVLRRAGTGLLILALISLLCIPALAAENPGYQDTAAHKAAGYQDTAAHKAAGGIISYASENTSYKDVNTNVSADAREKYTQKIGGGRDKVTIMVYMIGSDLESESGMATADLNEMLYAQIDNKNINMFIQTGGCKRWRNTLMTAGKLERWKLDSSGMTLKESLKGKSMTDENVLADFIKYCAKEAPADRYMLIFWDHGGGSVTGFGYDEQYPNDYMDIGEIGEALKMGGVKFDLVGFDACLMATMETAIAVEPYADYLLASEESEPGTGWYYTRWLQMLDNNSSTNTLSLGKQIIDDFTDASSSGMSYRTVTTLSLIDLAELSGTVLKNLGAFGEELTEQLKGQDYQAVATARNGTREFAQSQKLDQVDLVDFCSRLGTKEATQLAASIKSAVKYNKVSNVTNAYGLSIYFPNSRLKSVNSMLKLYESIGIDSNWSEGIRAYATLESSGQIAASSGSSYGSSSGNLIDILLGGSSYDDSAYSQQSGSQTYSSYDSMGVEDIYDMLGGGSSYSYDYDTGYGSTTGGGFGDIFSQLFGGYTTTSGDYYGGSDYYSIMGGYDGGYDSSSDYGYDSSSDSLLSIAAQLLFGRAPVGSETLRLTERDGEDVLVLSEDKWEQVTDAELNVFVDDGTGFLDLGLDNVADYNEEGDLIDSWDGTWLTLEGQPCAVYPISDEDEDGNGLYITRKYIPALLNGERINLIIEFNEETGQDRVLGAQSVTASGVLGKGYAEMNGGDEITLICDYYDYEGNFQAQYTLGDPVIVPEDCVLSIANKELTGAEEMKMLYTYRLTDIYQAHYWLPIKEK